MKAGLLLGAFASLGLAACSAPAGTGGSALPQTVAQGRSSQDLIGGGPTGGGLGALVGGVTSLIAPVGVTLSGTVVNQAGNPVAGATVSALLSGSAGGSATTSASGSFSLPVAGLGVYVLTVNNANASGADPGASVSLSVTVSAGQTGTISLGTLID